MKLKIILLLFFLIFTLIFNDTKANTLASNYSKVTVFTKTACDDFIRVRALIGVRWWIFVYTQEGSLVCVYPDEDD